MRRSLTRLVDFTHELLHRLRCWFSPAYADMAALAADESAQDFLRECRTNDWAQLLRERGYTVPIGTVLCGIRVTR